VRVITGTLRGKRLKEPDGMDIRPTTDKVKESVFNIIQFRVPGAKMLDLFAGTGQMGIEALSRGADEVVFTDKSRNAVKLIRENLKLTGLENKARVLNTDAVTYLGSADKFDIVFMDPPYDSPVLDEALQKAAAVDILNESGIILCECDYKKEFGELPSDYKQVGDYKYGRVRIVAFGK